MKTMMFMAGLAGFAAAFMIAGGAIAQTANTACDQATRDAVKQAKPAGAAEVTLVGRGNRAAEISKDGNVTELAPNKLVLLNRGKRVAELPGPPAAAPEPAKPGDKPNTSKEVEKDAKAEGEKAVQEALKEADVKSVEEMRKSRYMWFFDETGNVMTEEELDRRIAEKDLTGIKAVNDDRDEWTPHTAKPIEK